MKKYISILVAAVMAVCCLSACGQNNSNTNTQAKDNNDKQVKVVTTVFPEYCIFHLSSASFPEIQST